MRAPHTYQMQYYGDTVQALDPSVLYRQGIGQVPSSVRAAGEHLLQNSEPREVTMNVPRTWSTRSSSDVGQVDSGTDSVGEKHPKVQKSKKGVRKGKKEKPPSPTLAQSTYKIKFKTELCKNFELQGCCKFGDACCYAHGADELRDKKHLNSNYKSKICKHFHGQGGCPYGLRYLRLIRCQYVHVKDSYAGFFLPTLAEFIAIAERETGSHESLDIAHVLRTAPRL